MVAVVERDNEKQLVNVSKEHLQAYGYKGSETIFTAVKQREDRFSGIYNLLARDGTVVYGVMEEDLKEIS